VAGDLAADFPIVVHASRFRAGRKHGGRLVAEEIEIRPERGAEKTPAVQLECLVFEDDDVRACCGFPQLLVQASDLPP
jgi:hypothetical protein